MEAEAGLLLLLPQRASRLHLDQIVPLENACGTMSTKTTGSGKRLPRRSRYQLAEWSKLRITRRRRATRGGDV